MQLQQHDKYDVVLNGGTLEHVFNLPVALDNVFSLIKDNGFLVSISPANNFCNHGFYQFSPDIFMSLVHFNKGLDLKRLYLIESQHELQKDAPIWEFNHNEAKKENKLILYNGKNQTEILLVIKKKNSSKINSNIIQLSYVNSHKNKNTTKSKEIKKIKPIPEWIKFIYQVYFRKYIFYIKKYFTRKNSNEFYIRRRMVSI